MEHDPVRRRELSHLLGGGVDRESLFRMTIGVAGRFEGGAQPVGVRRTDPGADARQVRSAARLDERSSRPLARTSTWSAVYSTSLSA